MNIMNEIPDADTSLSLSGQQHFSLFCIYHLFVIYSVDIVFSDIFLELKQTIVQSPKYQPEKLYRMMCIYAGVCL